LQVEHKVLGDRLDRLEKLLERWCSPLVGSRDPMECYEEKKGDVSFDSDSDGVSSILSSGKRVKRWLRVIAPPSPIVGKLVQK